jgi:hypothetical protein
LIWERTVPQLAKHLISAKSPCGFKPGFVPFGGLPGQNRVDF